MEAKPVKTLAQKEQESAARIVKFYESRVKSPSTAIRAFCVQCTGGHPKEVTKCGVTSCALHPFRLGVNPFHGRVGQKSPMKGRKVER